MVSNILGFSLLRLTESGLMTGCCLGIQIRASEFPDPLIQRPFPKRQRTGAVQDMAEIPLILHMRNVSDCCKQNRNPCPTLSHLNQGPLIQLD